MRILVKSILLTFFVCFSQTYTHAIIAYHAPTTVPVKTLKQPKKVKFLKLLRELKNYNPKPRTKAEKIILYAFLIVSIIAFIYFLQGTIWLSIIGLITFLGIKAGKKQRERPEIVYLNEKGEEVVPTQSYTNSKATHGKSYASRSVKSFLRGLGLLGLAFLLFLVGSQSFLFDSGFFIIILFLAAIIAWTFISVAFIQSLKSISNKELDKDKAVLILILSLLFLLPLLVSLLGGFAGIFG